MKQGIRDQLEAKLKEMIKNFDEAEAEQDKPMVRTGAGNVIRRRQGKKDKRFFRRQ